MSQDPRRALPSVDALLRHETVRALAERHGHATVLSEARRLLDEVRVRVAIDDGPASDTAGLAETLARLLAERVGRAAAPSLVRVLNATGVVVHTNLGRAPLPAEALRRVVEVASGYSNLEYDLVAGERGNREVHVEARLAALLGVEAALAVNNNAAAVLLAVNSFAEGREVLVSRGELVEIGGSFRIPEILRKGGARLVEVGTTNRTRLADYRAALSPATALILKVHPSNFRVIGFTETTSTESLVGLAREVGLPLVEDQGSGYLQTTHDVLAGEETVAASLAAGVGLVTFSGDKLLGGPQAGLVAGRKELVATLRKNPLYRALRVDKLTIAALEAVLAEFQAGRANERVPVLRMLAATAAEIRARAEALAHVLCETQPTLRAEIVDGSSTVGGGAAPTAAIPTALLALDVEAPDACAARLRAHTPPVIVRIGDGRLLLDLRTVAPEDEVTLAAALLAVLTTAQAT
jgi:L-seryl-tRNA(Ser) seleniumtransferase